MSHNIHDVTFKKILSHEQHFIAFCKAYLPDDIKEKINWETIKLHKLNQEFILFLHGKQRKRIADVVYAVKYRDKDDDRECLILVLAEHYARGKRTLPLILLLYKLAALLDYAESNPNNPLPMVISVVYYQGETAPYPFSMDIYDLFEDKELAKKHLLNPNLVDLSQLSDETLQEHGIITPMELLMKWAFKRNMTRKDFDPFYNAITEHKDDETLSHTLKDVLHYATHALKYDKHQFVEDFIHSAPDLEDDMQTIAQQWKQEGREEGREEGWQEAREDMAVKMLKLGAEIDFVAKSSGLSRELIEDLYTRNEKHQAQEAEGG